MLLDAGHGGEDGGAVSPNGVAEAGINLNITLRTQTFLRLFGVSAGLTRVDENSLDYTPGAAARQNKNADLHARLELAQQNPDCDFISIHLNKFSQSKYSGAQVFYSVNDTRGTILAQCIQNQMKALLNPNNTREIKPAPEGVFLMKKIESPAVTVECGFLSNPEEEALLQQSSYQTKTAVAIGTGYLNYRQTDR